MAQPQGGYNNPPNGPGPRSSANAPPQDQVMPPPRGPRKLVAVSKFENKTAYKGQIEIDQGMTEQLTDSLIQSRRFVVLERQDLEDVLKEQNFAATDRTTSEGGAQKGQVARAQILIMGAITEFEANSGGGGQGIGYKGFQLEMAKNTAHLAVVIRLVDSSTGQVLASQRVEGHAEEGGLGVGYANSNFNIHDAGFKKTPIGKAMQIAIDNAVEFIAQRLDRVEWKGRVALVKEGKVYINAGHDCAIVPGDQFEVMHRGESIVDPDTGLNLGSEETPAGVVEASQVMDKYTIATPVSGQGFERGDTVRFSRSGSGGPVPGPDINQPAPPGPGDSSSGRPDSRTAPPPDWTNK
ncbi:MAG: CsgG/HfaB family protein [bacterium]